MATYRLMQARIRNPPSAGLKVDRRFLRDPPGDPGSEAATRALATERSRQLPVPGVPPPRGMKSFKNVPLLYISMERTERSAISSTERGTTPRTSTTAAEAHRAIEKEKRGGRGTGTSPSTGTMYIVTTRRR